MPTSSLTNKVTTGCTVRTPNCAISSTKNSGSSPGERATANRLASSERPPRVRGGATKRSCTPNQTRPVIISTVAPVQ